MTQETDFTRCKRIIPCLDVKDGRIVKGVNFKNLRDAGDPVELAHRYQDEGADEVVILDITATAEKRNILVPLVQKIAGDLDIPFTVGGGIRHIDQINELLKAGADKVSMNSAFTQNPSLINQVSDRFGAQRIVAAIDVKKVDGNWRVFAKGGTENTGFDVVEWAIVAARRGAGEILLTSMDRDGTKEGYDIELLKRVNQAVDIPVIASGGAGSVEDCVKAIKEGYSNAILLASILHFNEIKIKDLKKELHKSNVPVHINNNGDFITHQSGGY